MVKAVVTWTSTGLDWVVQVFREERLHHKACAVESCGFLGDAMKLEHTIGMCGKYFVKYLQACTWNIILVLMYTNDIFKTNKWQKFKFYKLKNELRKKKQEGEHSR